MGFRNDEIKLQLFYKTCDHLIDGEYSCLKRLNEIIECADRKPFVQLHFSFDKLITYP